eukprot:TRINITY_DN1639_c0_g2_i1.p1 TRINITY_DN1639_c0_g2~~TRINITY_DN1639_c0_g2_i1.p1  ORF type:complete len:241 (+),score=43.32 TRINITY_DN1639_c0_g2_i1:127-849(+)
MLKNQTTSFQVLLGSRDHNLTPYISKGMHPGILVRDCRKLVRLDKRRRLSVRSALSLPSTSSLSAVGLGIEISLAAVSAYLTASWMDRPRGWALSTSLKVQESSVHGRGVFAREDIPKGTIIGAYPGRVRSLEELDAKSQRCPRVKGYIFRMDNGMILDPTDMSGEPSDKPSPGLPWWPIDVSLAFVNEPPRGGKGTNIVIEVGTNPTEVMFVATRDIFKDEEVFVDYGLYYDRTSYLEP